MTEALVGAMWAAMIISTRRRPAPSVRSRLAALRPSLDRHERTDLLAAAGAAVLRVARRPVTTVRARQVGAVAVLAIPAAAVHLPLVVPAALAGWLIPALQARARRRRVLDAYAAGLPEVVDLLSLAVGAGLTVSLAVDAVARRATGPLADELARVREEVALGRRLADALDDLPGRCGEAVRPLVAALVASERYGAPLVAGLDRLAHEVRLERRRRAEEAVRKVPVKLLFPLVLCTLPAFALLTVAPLLASAIRSLSL